MWSFKKELHKLSPHQLRNQNCTVTVGRDFIASIPQQQLFFIDGLIQPTNFTIEFLLTDVLTGDPFNSISIGIDGNILTEDVPYIISPTITPNGGIVYDAEYFITPKTNYNPAEDSFTVTMTVTNIQGECVQGNNFSEFIFGNYNLQRNLSYDSTTLCPDPNVVGSSVYLLNTTENDWLQVNILRDTNFNLASPGYYKPDLGTQLLNDSFSRYWDGNQFTVNTTCP